MPKTSTKKSTTKRTAPDGPHAADVAPETATTATGASTKNGAGKARKGATKASKASKASKAAKTAAEPRADSKKAIILDLLRRPEGATMAEIAKATGWKAHSIRGLISGTLAKKMGLTVESTKNAAGERTYRIATK